METTGAEVIPKAKSVIGALLDQIESSANSDSPQAHRGYVHITGTDGRELTVPVEVETPLTCAAVKAAWQKEHGTPLWHMKRLFVEPAEEEETAGEEKAGGDDDYPEGLEDSATLEPGTRLVLIIENPFDEIPGEIVQGPEGTRCERCALGSGQDDSSGAAEGKPVYKFYDCNHHFCKDCFKGQFINEHGEARLMPSLFSEQYSRCSICEHHTPGSWNNRGPWGRCGVLCDESIKFAVEHDIPFNAESERGSGTDPEEPTLAQEISEVVEEVDRNVMSGILQVSAQSGPVIEKIRRHLQKLRERVRYGPSGLAEESGLDEEA